MVINFQTTGNYAIGADSDGLTLLSEYLAGTNPNDSDSDDDGLTDGEEDTHGTNPLFADSDQDGLSDLEELTAILPSLPLVSDSDGDGLSDALHPFMSLMTNFYGSNAIYSYSSIIVVSLKQSLKSIELSTASPRATFLMRSRQPYSSKSISEAIVFSI